VPWASRRSIAFSAANSAAYRLRLQSGVNFSLSVDFTVFGELTVFGRKTVGGFYSRASTPHGFTMMMGRNGRINPLGTGLASSSS
jgi:hypothetical protein